MQGLIRKTEKPTKKKQRKSNEKEMARDEPANKKSHVAIGPLSPCAGMSAEEATLPPQKRSDQDMLSSDNTEGGPASPPALTRPPFLLAPHPAFLGAGSLDPLPQKCYKYRSPGLLENLGWALETAFSTRCIWNMLKFKSTNSRPRCIWNMHMVKSTNSRPTGIQIPIPPLTAV